MRYVICKGEYTFIPATTHSAGGSLVDNIFKISKPASFEECVAALPRAIPKYNTKHVFWIQRYDLRPDIIHATWLKEG